MNESYTVLGVSFSQATYIGEVSDRVLSAYEGERGVRWLKATPFGVRVKTDKESILVPWHAVRYVVERR